MKRENIVTLNLCIVKRHFDLLSDKGDDQFNGQEKEDREELEAEDTKARGDNRGGMFSCWTTGHSVSLLFAHMAGMFKSSSEQ